jgi:hypothetical protein
MIRGERNALTVKHFAQHRRTTHCYSERTALDGLPGASSQVFYGGDCP